MHIYIFETQNHDIYEICKYNGRRSMVDQSVIYIYIYIYIYMCVYIYIYNLNLWMQKGISFAQNIFHKSIFNHLFRPPPPKKQQAKSKNKKKKKKRKQTQKHGNHCVCIFVNVSLGQIDFYSFLQYMVGPLPWLRCSEEMHLSGPSI